MRTLKFIVDQQIIKQDPNCDFSGLVPGTEGYLKADFSFSPEWSNCTKVAAFFNVMGKEFTPQVLADGKSCVIPVEALVNREFRIQIIGKRNELRLTTNKVAVSQDGGK